MMMMMIHDDDDDDADDDDDDDDVTRNAGLLPCRYHRPRFMLPVRLVLTIASRANSWDRQAKHGSYFCVGWRNGSYCRRTLSYRKMYHSFRWRFCTGFWGTYISLRWQ